MNKKTILTISKSAIIILILLAVVFALRAPAADLNILPTGDLKAEYEDASGLPYFSEMDSYYNLRLTENFVDHGYVGDELVDGSNWDMHRNSPDGDKINYELAIVWVTSFFYNIANQFFGDYTVQEVAFWTGAIVASLAVVPAFIFARRLTNDLGAITATLIIVLAPNYFAHTFPGFFDTDMFYYIFSLFFIMFFMESLRSKNLIAKVVFAILSIVSIGLFSQSWTGYIFYVGLMGIFSVVYLILCYVFNIGDSERELYPSKAAWFVHQKDLMSIVILGVIGFIGLAAFKGVDGVLGIFGSLTGLLSLQSTSTVVGGFPNVLISVAELQMPSMLGAGMDSFLLANSNGVINGIGGIFVFFAGLTVLFIFAKRIYDYRNVKQDGNTTKKPPKSQRLASSKKIDDDRKFKISLGSVSKFAKDNEVTEVKRLNLMFATLFIVWVVITALAVSRGSRFITTIVLPFGLMAGIFVGYASDYVKTKLDNDKMLMAVILVTGFFASYPLAAVTVPIFGIILFLLIAIAGGITIYGLKSSKSASTKLPVKKYVAIIAIALALITPTVCGAYQTANQVVPGTSDAMWDSMVWINENTADNTVVASWWDFGYLFEIAADRQVIFDGGSQSGNSRAFWLGQAMTTDNMDLSAGIFRMLGTSGENATNTLTDYTGSPGKATDILIDILPKNAQDAKNALINTYGLTTEQANTIIPLTHPDNPRPVIFVASSDMLQKAGWWSYFGAWDFDKQNSTNFNYYVPSQQVTVEPGSTGRLALINESGLEYDAVITRGTGNNTTTGHTEAVYSNNGSLLKINGSEFNPLNVSRIMVIEGNQLVKNESIAGAPSDSNYTLFLMGENNVYTPIIMHNKLADSMFTRLYLLGGMGQNVFSMVHMENGVSLWQVNYNNTAAGGTSTPAASGATDGNIGTTSPDRA